MPATNACGSDARHVPSDLEGGARASFQRSGLPMPFATTVTPQRAASCSRSSCVREPGPKRAKLSDADSYLQHPYLHDHAHPTLCKEFPSSPTPSNSQIRHTNATANDQSRYSPGDLRATPHADDDSVVAPRPRKVLKLASALTAPTPVQFDAAASSTQALPIHPKASRPPRPQQTSSDSSPNYRDGHRLGRMQECSSMVSSLVAHGIAKLYLPAEPPDSIRKRGMRSGYSRITIFWDSKKPTRRRAR